jgi:hypothetical protein
LLVFRVSFSRTCSNCNVWNTSLLVWRYTTCSFSRPLNNNVAFSSTTSRNLGREPLTGVGIKREIIKIHVM